MFVYRGYVGYCSYDGIWYGCVLDISELVEYKANTKAELELVFKVKVGEYIEIKNLSKKEM